MTTTSELDTATAVLDFARDRRRAADAAEADQLRAACAWAALHPAESINDAAVLSRHGEQPFAVAGPGAPLVAEFCVAEFALAVGLSTEGGKSFVGEAIELRHRLPKLWARVEAGDVQPWRARRVARATIALSVDAARFVDDQVAPFAHRVRPSQVDRLVVEAITRHMPAEARRRREAAADGRHVHVHTDQVSYEGTVWIEASLDLADALDLDAALSVGAARLADLGSRASLDVRRSEALGQMARHQLTFDPEGAPESTRQVVLHVHLTHAAITGEDHALHLARVDNTRTFVDADQVREWCRGAAVTLRPVVDLADQIRVDQYEVPARLAAQSEARDGTCVFPWCTRPASRCDKDHVIPFGAGGETASDNIANLCRTHHRLKTHSAWDYTMLQPGTYVWASPHGHRYLRDHTGTTDLSAHPPDQ